MSYLYKLFAPYERLVYISKVALSTPISLRYTVHGLISKDRDLQWLSNYMFIIYLENLALIFAILASMYIHRPKLEPIVQYMRTRFSISIINKTSVIYIIEKGGWLTHIVNRSIHGLEAQQGSNNRITIHVEGDLKVHKSFVLSLLIFKQHKK